MIAYPPPYEARDLDNGDIYRFRSLIELARKVADSEYADWETEKPTDPTPSKVTVRLKRPEVLQGEFKGYWKMFRVEVDPSVLLNPDTVDRSSRRVPPPEWK